MSLDHAEEEQVEALKAWWKNYGTSIVTGVMLGVSILGGYKYWNYQKFVKADEASLLYAQVLTDFRQNRYSDIKINGDILIKDYSSTPYSQMTALLLAKAEYEAGNKTEAESRLQWAVDNGVDVGLQHAARLRLGRILIEKKEFDKALNLIVEDAPGFGSAYQELKGDILSEKGNFSEAKVAYQLAIQKLGQDLGLKNILEMKLANLGAEDL